MPALFEAYVTNLGKYNEGELVGEYLKFPTTPEEVQALLKRIGIDGVRYEEIFITDFDGDVLGLYETAMRWTKGKYAFFVATHTDRQHIHNHIYYNSTSLDCSHKFRDFIGSARAVRRLSDRVCLENDLSVITNPKLHSKGRFLHYGAWLGAERQPSYKERLRAAICDVLAKGPDSFDTFLRLMEESGYGLPPLR